MNQSIKLNTKGFNKDVVRFLEKKVRNKFPIAPLKDYPAIEEGTPKGRPKAKLDNLHYEYFSSRMQSLEACSLRNIHSEYENVLVGVSRLNWYKASGKQKALSYKGLLKILASLEVITNERIQLLLGVEYGQASRYFRALRIAIPYMNCIHYE